MLPLPPPPPLPSNPHLLLPSHPFYPPTPISFNNKFYSSSANTGNLNYSHEQNKLKKQQQYLQSYRETAGRTQSCDSFYPHPFDPSPRLKSTKRGNFFLLKKSQTAVSLL